MIATDIFCVCIYLNLFVLLINRTRTFLKGMAERSPHFWQIMQNSFTSNFASIRRGWEKSAREILWRCGSFWSFWHHVWRVPSPFLPLLNRLVVGMTWPKAQSATRFLSLPVSRPICTPCITHSPRTALQPSQLAEHKKCSLTPNTLNAVRTHTALCLHAPTILNCTLGYYVAAQQSTVDCCDWGAQCSIRRPTHQPFLDLKSLHFSQILRILTALNMLWVISRNVIFTHLNFRFFSFLGM